MPKGERDKYKQYAESKGMSLNALIIQLLNKDMKQG
ncbi:MAG: Arc family DNA-binding protein [Clostridia bacterium]